MSTVSASPADTWIRALCNAVVPPTHAFSTLARVVALIRTVRVERDIVDASDDAPSRQLTVASAGALREVVAQGLANGYVPRVSGDRTTWVVESSGW